MDSRSTLDLSSGLPPEGNMAGNGAGRAAPASVSAGIAEANAHVPKPLETEPRFPAEDGGRSLAEVAHRDLEAALQLLAERAQYITGASGAAIALRRGEYNDMLCRASAGSNAPELGALLSMEYGLSGESVRTRQAMRCDDAERDPRVNREGCREMGIASVVVMPIVSEQQVLGVFELFSSTPHAFEERDLLALQRLSEMVETAVRHAVAAQSMPPAAELAGAESGLPGEIHAAEVQLVESVGSAIGADLALETGKTSSPSGLENAVVEQTEQEKPDLKEGELEKIESGPAVKNPLFWSATTLTSANSARANDMAGAIPVPAQLRDLQRCKACGFPVSRGRTLCVECEEKQLRVVQLPQPAARTVSTGVAGHLSEEGAPQEQLPEESAVIAAADDVPENSALKDFSSLKNPFAGKASPVEASSVQGSSVQSLPAQSSPVQPSSVQASGAATASAQPLAPSTELTAGKSALAAPMAEDLSQDVPQNVPENVSGVDSSTLFLSSAAPSESWLAANKYVLGVLLVVAIVVGLIALLR